MTEFVIDIDGEAFPAILETARAPKTVAAFLKVLPYSERIIHVRWSGEACWIPLGSTDFGVGYENATSHPAPGEVILYPGGVSETEILLAYGPTSFASKAGPLAGNHFMTIVGKLDRLAELGRDTLWSGAKPVLFRQGS
jgi:hypothetical protein